MLSIAACENEKITFVVLAFFVGTVTLMYIIDKIKNGKNKKK